MYRRAFDRLQGLARFALERGASSVGGMQAALGRRFPRYLRASARLARLASYALTGDQHYARRSLLRPLRDSVRIQVFRRGAIGDVLLTTPVLRALRAAHPSADISFGTLLPELLL